MRRKPFNTKRCPRCGTKNDYTQSKCVECGLIFSRVENGSNVLAKGLILSGQKDQVIKAPMFPKDVSKKKFMLLCGFLGFFGAHNFYVGRYVKAVFQLVIGIFSIIATFLSGVAPFFDYLMTFMFLPVAISAFMWMFDLVDGAINKYRIPVAVDFTNGKKLDEKQDVKSSKQDLPVEESKTQNNPKPKKKPAKKPDNSAQELALDQENNESNDKVNAE